MTRQKQFHEAISLACLGKMVCIFLYDGRCNVPGRACWKREIKGIPGYYVRDILQAIGAVQAVSVIKPDCPQQEEGNSED